MQCHRARVNFLDLAIEVESDEAMLKEANTVTPSPKSPVAFMGGKITRFEPNLRSGSCCSPDNVEGPMATETDLVGPCYERRKPSSLSRLKVQPQPRSLKHQSHQRMRHQSQPSQRLYSRMRSKGTDHPWMKTVRKRNGSNGSTLDRI